MPSDYESQNDDVDALLPAKDNSRSRLFENSSFPVAFILHKSIKRPDQRKVLTDRIESHGGVVLEGTLDDYKVVDTVLVHPTYSQRDSLLNAITGMPERPWKDVWVEDMYFINHCITHQHFRHRNREIRAMGGALGFRRPFTKEDDSHLAYYLATKIPNFEAGGHKGEKIYKSLVENYEVLPDLYGWVKRHPWQSWQNRYKKNQGYFDEKIAEIVAEKGPPCEQQLYGMDRRASKHNRRVHGVKRLSSEDESSGVSSGSESEEDELKSDDKRELENAVASAQSSPRKASESSKEVSRKRKEPTERHSFRAGKPSKKVKISQHSSHTRPPRELPTEIIDLDESEDERPPADAVVNPYDAGSSRPPSPTLVSNVQLFNVDVGPQLSAQATLIGSPIDITLNSSKTGIEVIDFVSDPSDDDVSVAPSPLSRANPPRFRSRARHVQTQPSPKKSQQKPRPPKVQTATDAPYRNTRARSRSVEPSNLPATTGRKKKTARQPSPEPDALDPVIEDDDHENEPDIVAQGDSPATERQLNTGKIPVGESASAGTAVLEEMDVERLLTAETQNLTAASGPSAGQTSQTISQDYGISQTLDSDDAQTDRHLRRASQAHLWEIGFNTSTMNIDPADLLREFEASSSARWPRASLGSTSTAVSYSRFNRTSKPRYSEPSQQPPRSMPSRTVMQTPKVQKISRMKSESSSESFPLAGTRASATKRDLEQKEMQKPYYPPNGTRAAEFAAALDLA